jgi:hypothetical protein
MSRCSRCKKDYPEHDGLDLDVTPLQKAIDVLGVVASGGYVKLCEPCTDALAKWWQAVEVVF